METASTKRLSVHRVLSHSYSVYFIFLLLSIYLDFLFDFKLFSDTLIVPVGFFFLGLASIVIIWAQRTGHEFRKIKEKRTEHFCRGPYCYTRIPTQWGLFFLMLGFGLVTNSFFVVLFSVISFLIAKFVFIEKQERILEAKYGTHYSEYKKLVRF